MENKNHIEDGQAVVRRLVRLDIEVNLDEIFSSRGTDSIDNHVLESITWNVDGICGIRVEAADIEEA